VAGIGRLRQPEKYPNSGVDGGVCIRYMYGMRNASQDNRYPSDRRAASVWRGRGAGLNPANRYESRSLTVLNRAGGRGVGDAAEASGCGAGGGECEAGGAAAGEAPVLVDRWADADGRSVETRVYSDRSRSMLNRVDSPDLGFQWTVNPYRGCEHGCVYCYARPTHEQLGFSSGLDFESQIMAKLDAVKLLRKELARPRWRGEPIVMSGVTDAYQPAESRLGVTRGVLELFAEARQPVSIVTKSRLILRDLDLLGALARHDAVHVAVSLTTLDRELSGRLEPRAASPRDRLWTMRRLASAGIPVAAMVAPVIPALTDRETPRLLKAAADAGAQAAGYVMLRLPHANKQLFDDWLGRHYPGRRQRVLSRVREMHDGSLYNAEFGDRMRGRGAYADQVRQTFEMFRRRHRLAAKLPPLNSDDFRRPDASEQLSLFEAA